MPTDIELRPVKTPAESFGEFMMQALANPDISAEKLQVLLQARREVLADQAREAFAIAFAHMAPEMPKIEKRGQVELITKDGRELGRYSFARWEDIDEVIRPILARHGFGLMFTTAPSDKGNLVTAELSYGGYTKTSSIMLPPDAGPGRNSLQAVGGAISYGKRYTAGPMLNIVTHEDDDATSLQQRKITTDQVEILAQLLQATRTDVKNFLQLMVTGAEELKDVQARDYVRLLNALNQKKSKVAARG